MKSIKSKDIVNLGFNQQLKLCILSLAFCLVSLASFSQDNKSTNVQTINGKKYLIHIVQKSQSLYAISKMYNVDVNLILAENDEAIEGLKAGQELKIPILNQPAEKTQVIDTNKYVYHKVVKGETLYSIAKKHNKTEQHLLDLNPGLTTNIKEGQYIALYEKLNKIKPHIINVRKDTVAAAKVDTFKISKEKKTSYNVGLFLPFKLSESETINPEDFARAGMSFPLLQSISIDFYMGFKKAVDSLSEKNFEVNIQLFDIDDRDSVKAETICKSPEFKTLDMIVGPLYTSAFKIVSTYARKANIPIVSPLTQQSKILYNNPYVSKINPSLFTLIEGLADFCQDSLSVGNNVMIVNNGSVKDLQYIKAFKKQYNDRLISKGKALKDSIIEVKGLTGVKNAFVPNKKNIIVLLTNNQVFLADFITQLYVYTEKKDMTLLGFSSVSEIDNLDQEYLNKLHFHFASSSNINYKDSLTMKLTKSYQDAMNTDPSDYYYEAFDIGTYFMQHLKEQGPALFMQLDKYKTEGVSTKFNFYRPDASTGFENKAVYIYKYNEYRLLKTGWKN